MSNVLKDKLENILKFCNINFISGKDGDLQQAQIKTLRNIEDAMKVGQFGFNSKAPNGSKGIVTRIGNENIIIANEHFASIIDVATGDTIIYNQAGTSIELKGTDIIATCSNFIVNASSSFTVNSPSNEINGALTVNGNASFIGGTVQNDGTNIGGTHQHTQTAGDDFGAGGITSTPNS
jgi:phage gp45-like